MVSNQFELVDILVCKLVDNYALKKFDGPSATPKWSKARVGMLVWEPMLPTSPGHSQTKRIDADEGKTK